ncbi:MAG: sn-glycerol 3-phosphate transport system substrate-binding protein [Pseudomonadota bacterium]|jgi:sn-glycerol 3-phosphate transport system substrate-binding protein|nr:sn-glycerol 3-phosphate transport system substrate-binding protein [Pseudomonadota bacterium]
MQRTSFPKLAAGLFISLGAIAPVQAVTEVDFYHQLDRARGEKLAGLVEQFNAQSKDYRVKLVQSANVGAPAVLNLATPANVATFSESQAKFRPLHKVMADAKEKFDGKQFTPELRVRVTDAKGNLVALPLAMSTPVLFYNKNAFRKAGLDPNTPPKTWWEVQTVAGKLLDSGLRCPYTTSWPAWVHIDNTSALNGSDVAGPKGDWTFNSLVQVKHIALLASWHKSFYFHYFGRGDEADRHFAAGECGMLTTGSAFAATLRDSSSLDIGVAPLPYYDDVFGAPQHTLADGASVWIGEGKSPAEYKAAASFIQYLVTPEVQVEVTRMGGFLPMTSVARAVASSKLLAGDLAGLHVAYGQLKKEGATHPLRVSQVEPVRIIVEEELEAVWANKKPAKEALDTAVARGNVILVKNSAPVEKAKPVTKKK